MCRMEVTLLVKPLWGPREAVASDCTGNLKRLGCAPGLGAPLTERICGLRQKLEWGKAQVIQRLRTNLNILKPIKLGNLLKEAAAAA